MRFLGEFSLTGSDRAGVEFMSHERSHRVHDQKFDIMFYDYLYRAALNHGQKIEYDSNRACRQSSKRLETATVLT